jgi:hypothetical protein
MSWFTMRADPFVKLLKCSARDCPDKDAAPGTTRITANSSFKATDFFMKLSPF